MTHQLYLDDTYLMKSNAYIISSGSDEKGQFLVLDSTIFYPQGGGQPSDKGHIIIGNKIINVTFVRQVGQEIRHYVSQIQESWINLNASLEIDSERRLLNARYHTAAHLLSNVVEEKYNGLKAIKGHSFPGEAYVEFMGNNEIEIADIENYLDEVIHKKLSTQIFKTSPQEFEEKFYKLPYKIPDNKDFRVLKIQNFLPTPCGGTHVTNIFEIGQIKIRKISRKNEGLKIMYDVLDL